MTLTKEQLAERRVKMRLAFDRTADLLDSGYALLSDDLGEILDSCGLPPAAFESFRKAIVGNQLALSTPIVVEKVVYRGHRIIMRAGLRPEETDLGRVKDSIDAKWEGLGEDKAEELRRRRINEILNLSPYAVGKLK